MKNKEKLDKKELKEGLHTHEDRIHIFRIYHLISLLCYCLVFSMYSAINGINYYISWFWVPYIISISVFVFKGIMFKKYQLDDFDYLTKQEVDKIVDNFTSYFFIKGKRRDNLEIEHILKRIEKAELHFKNYDKLYKINNGLSVFSIYSVFLFFVPLISVFFSGSLPNTILFNSFLLIIYPLNSYLIFVYIIRNTHIKNLERSKSLFKKSIYSVIEDLTNKIEEIALFMPQNDFIKAINNNLFLSKIQEWFNRYLGNFKDDLEHNQLLYKYRNFIIDQEREEYFLSLFVSVKSKMQFFSLFLRKNNNKFGEKVFERINTLEEILNYVISILKFNIDYKKSRLAEKRGRQTLILTIAIVFTNIISIIGYFFPL